MLDDMLNPHGLFSLNDVGGCDCMLKCVDYRDVRLAWLGYCAYVGYSIILL